MDIDVACRSIRFLRRWLTRLLLDTAELRYLVADVMKALAERGQEKNDEKEYRFRFEWHCRL